MVFLNNLLIRGHIIKLINPNSSSSVINTTPDAVLGFCRLTTKPTTSTSSPFFKRPKSFDEKEKLFSNLAFNIDIGCSPSEAP